MEDFDCNRELKAFLADPKTYTYLKNKAKSLIHNKADQDDLIQETYFRALKGNYTNQSTPYGWLSTIMYHVHIDNSKRYKSKFEFSDSYSPNALGIVSSQYEIRDFLENAISNLPEMQKHILELRMHGFKYHEIAKILKINSITCRVYFTKAKNRY